ncbi:hypothetical protein [Priestia filamentosa]|uniref:hypothetical protein n=1 Tax=Priestia filamentosa TaxID=1402861 RepID=UPI000A082017|nr:hypothetical protein [Priestia filamentosa]MDT3765702.1 hypothetical protein [Priestia filamentosa]OXS66272.1 hypothetical protein B1B01_20030 [Priestia filamentosa]WRU95621.1 hypothetical protein RYX51_00495 [Priestia filamentosa]SMF59921.1 hypothetical protein SAMN06296056_106155 [Priestia filamentosa]
MGFSFFVFLSFLSITLFVTMRKSLSIVENTFVYLLVLIININATWIINEELKLIVVTEETASYVGFLLERSLIIPILFVITFNYFYRNITPRAIMITGFILLIFTLLLRKFSNMLNIYHYRQWNLFYEALYILGLLLIIFVLHKGFRRLMRKEKGEFL